MNIKNFREILIAMNQKLLWNEFCIICIIYLFYITQFLKHDHVHSIALKRYSNIWNLYYYLRI